MAIQELNSVELNEVAGALGFNLGNGALNPINGLVNTLINLDLQNGLPLTLAGVLGAVTNPWILLEAVDLGGILSVGSALLGDELGGLGLGL